MLGLGVALTIVGLIFVFVLPWLGVSLVAAGLAVTGSSLGLAGARSRPWRPAR